MKKNPLEEFVRDHRNDFDDKTPAPETWRRISQAILGARSISLWNSVSLWRAAAIVLMTVSIFLVIERQLPVREMKSTLVNPQDFKDIESFYAAQISEKVALISDEGLFADDSFTQDLQKLEVMYTVISEEMKKHPSEKVKDALVLNMLVRIDLLNQQIQKLEDSNRIQKPAANI